MELKLFIESGRSYVDSRDGRTARVIWVRRVSGKEVRLQYSEDEVVYVSLSEAREWLREPQPVVVIKKGVVPVS